MEEVTDEVEETAPSTNANDVPQSKSPSSENPSTVPLSDNVSVGSPEPLEETQSLALQDVDLNPSNSNSNSIGGSVLCDHSTAQGQDHSCEQLDSEKTYSEDSGNVSHQDDVDQTSACLSDKKSIEGGSDPDGQSQDNTRDTVETECSAGISEDSPQPTIEAPTHPHLNTLDSDRTPSSTGTNSYPTLSDDEPPLTTTTVKTPHDTSESSHPSDSDAGLPPSKEIPPMTQAVGGAELETPPATQPVGRAELEIPPVTQPAELKIPPVTQPVGEIPPVTQPVEEMRTGVGELAESSQTSFVNESALDSDNSPTYEVDRSLEQFSEILLDSDSSHSDNEAQAREAAGAGEESPRKAAKKVRFADEVSGKLEVEGERERERVRFGCC